MKKYPLTSILVCAMITLGNCEGIPMNISAQGNVTSSLSTNSLNAPNIKFNGKPYDQSLIFLQNADTQGVNYSYKKEVDGLWQPIASAPVDAGHYQLVATTTTSTGKQSLVDFEVPKSITLSPDGKMSEKISVQSVPAGLNIDGLYFSFVPKRTAEKNPLADGDTGVNINGADLSLDFSNTEKQNWIPENLELKGANLNPENKAKIDKINQKSLITLDPATGQVSLTDDAKEAVNLVGTFYTDVLVCKNINGKVLAKDVRIEVKSQKASAAYIQQSIKEGGELVWTGLDHSTIVSSNHRAALTLEANVPKESSGNWYCNNKMIISDQQQSVASLDPQVESGQSFVTCALDDPDSGQTLNVNVNEGNPSPEGAYNFLYQYKNAEGSQKTLLYVVDVGDPYQSKIQTAAASKTIEYNKTLTLMGNKEGESLSCLFQPGSIDGIPVEFINSIEIEHEGQNISADGFIEDISNGIGTPEIRITPPVVKKAETYTVKIESLGSSGTFTVTIFPALQSLETDLSQIALYGEQLTELKIVNLPVGVPGSKLDWDLKYKEKPEDLDVEAKKIITVEQKEDRFTLTPNQDYWSSTPIKLELTIKYFGPVDGSNTSNSSLETPDLTKTIDVLYYAYPKSIALPAAFNLGVGQSVNLNEYMTTLDGTSISAAPVAILKAEKEGIIKIVGNRITALKAGETWLDASWVYESQNGPAQAFATGGLEIENNKSAHANGILIHVSSNSSTKTESDDFYIEPLKPFGTIGEAGLGMGNFTTSHTYGILNDVNASVAAWKKADLYVGGRYIKESECTRQLGDLITSSDRGSFYPGKLSFHGNYTGDFYVPTIQSWNNPFDDVKKQADSFAWNSYIPAASIAGLMKGVHEDEFDPARTITRGEWILAMYRMAGEPEVSPEVEAFVDVPEESFYYTASRWAREHEISYGDGTNSLGQPLFKGQSPVQRQQAVSFMYRLGLDQGWIEQNELEEVAWQYSDGANINPGNLDGVNWALDNLVITGKGEGETKTIDPTGGMLRGDATKPLVEGYLILRDPVTDGGAS